jgi:hypothetical protein
MSMLRWKNAQFKIVGQPLTQATFAGWINSDGRKVLDQAVRELPWRWFFGRKRARRSLFKKARIVMKPTGEFSQALKTTLDELPTIVRGLGIVIKKREYRDLYSADAVMALVTTPRAIVQGEFLRHVQEKLSVFPGLIRFEGLTKHVLAAAAKQAEDAFFRAIEKGEQYIHDKGQSIILGVNAAFSWRQKNADGHYYIGYAGKNGMDLTKRKDMKQFKSEMSDVLAGQERHLRRLNLDERAAVADALRTGKPSPRVGAPRLADVVVDRRSPVAGR